jgi:enoyl-CoA hydratase/carnithine racemase
MVRAVASRVVPRQRISKAMAKEAASEASRAVRLALNAELPMSVNRIPTRAGADLSASAVAIRPMGNSRRVFLLDPHMEADEIEGMAHRIRALSKNEGINSVLIATDDKDDQELNCLPRYLTQANEPDFGGVSLDFEPAPNQTWHVSGGYDPLKVANAMSEPGAEDKCNYLLESIKKLSMATKGDGADTRVPIISFPHGVVTDAGYSLCMGGYVLATRESSFRILNPSRGLSLDPVGFSYILPRLGWEHEQRSSKYPGCGMILALSGYEANSFDMVETGLATHLVSDSAILSTLEHNLASIAPWDQQKLVKKTRHSYGQPPPRDANASLRNVTIANVIDQMSEHSANPANSFPFDFTVTNAEDPALDTDHVPWESGFFSSELVDIAAHLDEIFQQEKTLEGLVERLKEAGSQTSEDPDEQLGIEVAKNLVKSMGRQSPLALSVTYQLMKMGGGRLASLENCMEREAKAQLKMFGRPDFSEWAKHVTKHGGEANAPSFAGWKHESIKAVSTGEVDEILS